MSESPISELPARIGQLAQEIPHVGFNLMQSSLDRIQPYRGPFSETLFLRRLDAHWRIYLATAINKTVFFFFKLPSEVRLTMDLSIDSSVRPAIQAVQPPESVDDILLVVTMPPFILRDVSEEDLKKFAPKGGNASNTVFLAMGPSGRDILAVTAPDQPRLERLRFSPGGKPGPDYPDGASYPLAPFLEFLGEIREWVASDFMVGPQAKWQPAPHGTPSLPAARSERTTRAQEIVRQLVDSYRKWLAGLAQTPRHPMTTPYRAENFRVSLLLRLNPDGTLASSDAEDSFQLRLWMEFEQSGASSLARVRVGTPDFLISGDLFLAIVERLQTPEQWREIADQIGTSEQTVREWIADFAERGSIFRIKRSGETDFEAFVLPRVPDKDRPTLIFNAELELDASASPPVVKALSNIRVQFPEPQDDDETTVDYQTIEFFFRLLASLKQWVGAIP